MRSDLLNEITQQIKDSYRQLFPIHLYPEKPIRHTLKRCVGFFRQQLQSVRAAAIWLLGLTIPAALPLHVHEEFHWMAFSKAELLANLKELSSQVHTLIEQVEAERAAETNEYLTTREFARMVGLEPKTISNYASSGRLEAKKEGGSWLIHKTELQRYGKG